MKRAARPLEMQSSHHASQNRASCISLGFFRSPGASCSIHTSSACGVRAVATAPSRCLVAPKKALSKCHARRPRFDLTVAVFNVDSLHSAGIMTCSHLQRPGNPAPRCLRPHGGGKREIQRFGTNHRSACPMVQLVHFKHGDAKPVPGSCLQPRCADEIWRDSRGELRFCQPMAWHSVCHGSCWEPSLEGSRFHLHLGRASAMVITTLRRFFAFLGVNKRNGDITSTDRALTLGTCKPAEICVILSGRPPPHAMS